MSQSTTISQFEPQRNEPCLCGSGMTFEDCCFNRYREGPNTNAYLRLREERYEEALIECRLHLSWYVICHRTHTIPLLKTGSSAGMTLLEVDIDALAGILNQLLACYRRVGRVDEFNAVLDHLEESIADRRWREKVACVRAKWWLYDQNNQDNARDCMSSISIDQCADTEIISMYLELFGQDLSFDRSDDLFDRIISNTDEDDIRLQYTCARGIARLKICEREEAIGIIEPAVDHFRSINEDAHTLYGKHLFANSLQLLGILKNDSSLIRESAEKFHLLIDGAKEYGLSELAVADYLCELGRCCALLGEHTDAIEHYVRSNSVFSMPLTQIYLAQSYVEVGDEEASRETLKAIARDELSDVNRQDYAIACSMLAASSCKAEDIDSAIAELRAVSPRDPYFVRMRDEWLIALLQTEPKARRSKLRTLLQSFNRYVTLNPNVFGIGIDINNILEDIDRRAE
jgi:tetratricopeptide (TPR) repeat protein